MYRHIGPILIFFVVTFSGYALWDFIVEGAVTMFDYSPDFQADLVNTLDLQAGVGKPTFTRADVANNVATFTDFEGIIKTVKSNEARFEGARRVENGVTNSENLTADAGWTITNATLVQGATDPNGGSTAWTMTANEIGGRFLRSTNIAKIGDILVSSIWIRRVSGTGVVSIYSNTGGFYTIPVTSSWQRVSYTFSPATWTNYYFGIRLATSGDVVEVWHPQAEISTGQSNQNPSEYVSTNVLSSPFHGAGVDGVKYFKTLNGNTVSSNVVTEAVGTSIPDATLKGYLAEGSRTNSILYSKMFGNPLWVASNITLGASTTDPSGSLSGGLFTAVANDATISQSFTGTAANAVFSVYLKRQNGTGDVSISVDGTNFTSCVINSTTWTRCIDSRTLTVASHSATIKLTANGDSVYAWGAQVERSVAFASSYIVTTSATRTRAQDALSYSGSNVNNIAISAYSEVFGNYPGLTSIPSGYGGILGQTASINRILYFSNTFDSIYTQVNGSSINVSAGNSVNGTMGRVAMSINNSRNIVFKDGTASTAVLGSALTGTDLLIGSAVPGIIWSGTIRNVKIWKKVMSDAFLASLTTSNFLTSRSTIKKTTVNASQNDEFTTGLIGYWPFNGKDIVGDVVYDRSGKGNNGTMVNGPTKVVGKLGQALKFDASRGLESAYVTVPNSSSITSSSSMTVSFWTKPSVGYGTPTSNPGLVAKKGSWGGLWVSSVSGGVWGRFFQSDSTVRELSLFIIPIERWSFISATADSSSGTIKLYINGILKQSLSYDGTLRSSTDALLIARQGTENFAGSLDDVRIYNRALSASEITKLYSSGLSIVNASQNTKQTSDLVGYWSFNQPDFTDKIYDRSGQGNDAYFSGGATSTAKTIGKVGQGMRFDGVDDYVSAGFDSSLNITGQVTLSAWVKLSSAPSASGNPDIIDKWDWVGGLRSYSLGTESGRFSASVSKDCTFPNRVAAISATTPELGVWTHIAMAYNGQAVTLYQNGVSIASASYASPESICSTPATAVWLGRSRGSEGAIRFFPGIIDEARIYNRALPVAEIKQLYNLGK